MKYGIFEDKDGTFSFRKLMTAGVLVIFMYSVVGYLHGLPEIPQSYQLIVAGVFAFYFGKEMLKKTNGNKPE